MSTAQVCFRSFGPWPTILALVALAGPSAATPAGSPPADSSGTIHGRVLGPIGPLAYSNVVVLGTRRGAVCDTTGAFVITHVPPGTWTVRAQPLGYLSLRAVVTIRAWSDTNLVLTATEDPQRRARTHPVPDCSSTERASSSGDSTLGAASAPDTTRWWTASGSVFDFSLPMEFRRKHVQGIDSEVGEWDADSTRIFYDLGEYSGCGQFPGDHSPIVEECFGGFRARIRRWTEPRRFCLEACFPSVGLNLSASAPDEAELTRISAAFRTIRFHDVGAPRNLTGPLAPLLPVVRPSSR